MSQLPTLYRICILLFHTSLKMKLKCPCQSEPTPTCSRQQASNTQFVSFYLVFVQLKIVQYSICILLFHTSFKMKLKCPRQSEPTVCSRPITLNSCLPTLRFHRLWAQSKAMNPKYPKDWPHHLAATMICSCSKMVNHGTLAKTEIIYPTNVGAQVSMNFT